MSRVQAAALAVELRPVGVEEVVVGAVASLGAEARDVVVDVPDDVPDVSPTHRCSSGRSPTSSATPSATRPPSAPVRVRAGDVLVDGRGRVDISVIDRGPGIRPADRELVFQPFQRVVDHQADGRGVGLGLAIARGFVEAMGGELAIEDTPGGGTTMVVGLPAVAPGRP